MTRELDNPVRGIRWVKSVAIVDVQGEIDLRRSVDFQSAMMALVDQKPSRIVVSLAEVPYMDSSGIASLVKLLARSRRDGIELRLFGLTKRVQGLFEITKLDNVFTICADEPEATG